MTNMSATIDVDTDPATAFKAFTEEYDQWWGNGPIDAYESWRLVERRIEPGVGGRLIEDYGDEERALGAITVWEPGARLAWTTRNDVTIEVTFVALSQGTRVTVTGVVPDGVDGTAQLSMVRMAPQWFPRHLERRQRAETLPESSDTPLVHVGDLDAHLAHAEAAGATIVTPIVEHGYRGYTAADCEGRHWQFMQAGPRIGH
jgi:hypothetical protein